MPDMNALFKRLAEAEDSIRRLGEPSHHDRKWEWDKRIPIIPAALLLGQLFTFGWYGSKLDSRVAALETEASKNSTLVERVITVEITMNNVVKALDRLTQKLDKSGDDVASRKIDDLAEPLQFLCRRFLQECEAQGIQVLVTCTYRSAAEQDELYAIGRSKPGKVITNARGGKSQHNATQDGQPAARAFDIAVLRNGKIDWDIANPHWKQAGAIGQKLGLDWGGAWRRFTDYPHFQLKS